MRIKKTSQTTTMSAQVVNTYDESQENAYSCDYINNSDSYSTSEVKTNKRWIDGKPIYRVCKNIGYLPNNGRIVPSFEGLIPTTATITKLDGITHRYANDVHDYRPLAEMVITFLYRPAMSALYVDTNQDVSNWECIAIIEYTKTTD